MTTIDSSRNALRSGGACLLVALAAAGCHDASGDPFAIVTTGESHPALAVEPSLPSLPDLAARSGAESEVSSEVSTWLASWTVSPEEGSALRAGLYGSAAGPVARRLGDDGVRETLEQVALALDAVRELEARGLPDDLAAPYGEASLHYEDAVAALADGRSTVALAKSLEASDALRTVGPESVARFLVARGERALEDGADAGMDPVEMERADRLLAGARQALDAEAWTLAVRRAFYACQILGLDPR